MSESLIKKYGVIFDNEGIKEGFDALEESVSEKAKNASDAAGRPQDEKIMFVIGMIFVYAHARQYLRNFQTVELEQGGDDWAQFIEDEILKIDEALNTPGGL